MPARHANDNKTAEPIIALPMPPPSPTGFGDSTRNASVRELTPRRAMYQRIIASTPTARIVHNDVRPVIVALIMRRVLSDRESFMFFFVLPLPLGEGWGEGAELSDNTHSKTLCLALKPRQVVPR